jgi:hypothetical protein
VAGEPTREFGRRRPVAIAPAAPVKRSSHVALLLMGTFAIGAGAYALMPNENCGPRPGMAADLQSGAECPPRGSSSGGGHGGSGGSSSRPGFFGADSSSNHVATADSGSGGVTRGGFGAFAHSFASHFSRGG